MTQPPSKDSSRGTQALRMALRPGYRLGDYEVESELGRGAYGAVLAGRRVSDGAEVAIKILLGPQLRKATSRERFLREARAAGRVEHPGVIRVLDSGEQDGVPFLVMERIRGGTLEDALPTLSRDGLLKVLEGVAEALAAAHAAGVVHRDLKPGNVMLRADGTPVVTDFGLAWAHDMGQSLTQSGSLLGTPLYMSPEQCRGQRAGPRGDVYAWGVMAYEGLCGCPPFAASSLVEQLRLVVSEAPTPLLRHRPDVPRWLDDLILRCLAKSPERRPAMAEVHTELRARGGPARRRGRAAALGVVAVGVAAAAGIVGLGPAQPTPSPAPSPAVEVPGAPQAQVWTLQPGPVWGRDTYVLEPGLYKNDNLGIEPALYVGERIDMPGSARAFLRFDLERLPPGAQVERATLSLHHRGFLYAEHPLQLLVHVVAACPPRTPWREGTGMSDAYLEGMAWDGDIRGRLAPGMDPMSLASERPDLTQPDVLQQDFGHGPGGLLARSQLLEDPRFKGWVELDVTAAVQAWVNGALENHGFRLSHAGEGEPWDAGFRVFSSSDHRDAALRPKLTIRYQGSPPPQDDADEAREQAARVAEAERLLAGFETGELGWGDEAWETVQRAIELAPVLGRAYYWRARQLFARDYRTGALQELRRADAAAIRDESAEQLGLRSQALLRHKEPESALKLLQAERAGWPEDTWLAALEAEALAALGKVEEAARCLEPFRDHPDWRILEGLAVLQVARGEGAAARDLLERSCELLQRLPDPLPDVRPLIFLARLAHQTGDSQRADAALDLLERRGGLSPADVYSVVPALRACGRDEAAQRLLSQARARWPHNRGLARLR